MVEIAITAVNLGRKDKGIIYKFTYEAIPGSKRSPAVPPSPSIRNRPLQNINRIQEQGKFIPTSLETQHSSIGVDYNEEFSSSPPLVRPAGASKKPRPQNNYKLTTKVRIR